MLRRLPTGFRSIGIVLMGTIGTIIFPHPRTTVNAYPLNARLVVEKSTIVLGEPLFISYSVHNAASKKALMMLGTEGYPWPESSDGFQFSAVRTDGLKVVLPRPDRNAVMCCGCITYSQEIKAHASYTFIRFLPADLPITLPGTYTITCRKMVRLLPTDRNGNVAAHGQSTLITTQARTTLTILPPTHGIWGR